MFTMIEPDLKKKILADFKCQQSGNCCRCPGIVYVSPENVEGMARQLGVSVFEFRQRFVVKRNGWDVIADKDYRPDCFLDLQNLCQIYESRPQKCRTYPDWPEIWESEESLKAETRTCPGLKKATETHFLDLL